MLPTGGCEGKLMKFLKKAVEVFAALAEGSARVTPSTLWSWNRTIKALEGHPELVESLREMGEVSAERVLRYTSGFYPLKYIGEAYVFPDAQAANRFFDAVENGGGSAERLNDTIVSAYSKGDLVKFAAASNGGAYFDAPELSDICEYVDARLPYDLHTAGICGQQLVETLTRSMDGQLHESTFRDSEPAFKFRGRLTRFIKARPQILGVDTRLVEAMVRGGYLPNSVQAYLRENFRAVFPIIEQGEETATAQQQPTAGAQAGADQASGGTTGQQGEQGGSPAQSKSEPPEEPKPPTEHVPTKEEGAPSGDVKLPDGTIVPEPVIKQAMAKMLKNLATQLENDTVGGQPKPKPDDPNMEGKPQPEDTDIPNPTPDEVEQGGDNKVPAETPPPASPAGQQPNYPRGPQQESVTESLEGWDTDFAASHIQAAEKRLKLMESELEEQDDFLAMMMQAADDAEEWDRMAGKHGVEYRGTGHGRMSSLDVFIAIMGTADKAKLPWASESELANLVDTHSELVGGLGYSDIRSAINAAFKQKLLQRGRAVGDLGSTVPELSSKGWAYYRKLSSTVKHMGAKFNRLTLRKRRWTKTKGGGWSDAGRHWQQPNRFDQRGGGWGKWGESVQESTVQEDVPGEDLIGGPTRVDLTPTEMDAASELASSIREAEACGVDTSDHRMALKGLIGLPPLKRGGGRADVITSPQAAHDWAVDARSRKNAAIATGRQFAEGALRFDTEQAATAYAVESGLPLASARTVYVDAGVLKNYEGARRPGWYLLEDPAGTRKPPFQLVVCETDDVNEARSEQEILSLLHAMQSLAPSAQANEAVAAFRRFMRQRDPKAIQEVDRNVGAVAHRLRRGGNGDAADLFMEVRQDLRQLKESRLDERRPGYMRDHSDIMGTGEAASATLREAGWAVDAGDWRKAKEYVMSLMQAASPARRYVLGGLLAAIKARDVDAGDLARDASRRWELITSMGYAKHWAKSAYTYGKFKSYSDKSWQTYPMESKSGYSDKSRSYIDKKISKLHDEDPSNKKSTHKAKVGKAIAMAKAKGMKVPKKKISESTEQLDEGFPVKLGMKERFVSGAGRINNLKQGLKAAWRAFTTDDPDVARGVIAVLMKGHGMKPTGFGGRYVRESITESSPQWRKAAQQLLKQSEADSSQHDQEGLSYRMYLRAIIQGQPTAQFFQAAHRRQGAERARSDLIDLVGVMESLTESEKGKKQLFSAVSDLESMLTQPWPGGAKFSPEQKTAIKSVLKMLRSAHKLVESLDEQLDVGQEDEAAAAGKGFADAAQTLKKARQHAFELVTDNLVRLESLAKAIGAKRTNKLLAKMREGAEGYMDQLKVLADTLDKANDSFKAEGGQGGEVEQQAQNGEAPAAPAPAPENGNGAPAPENGNGVPEPAPAQVNGQVPAPAESVVSRAIGRCLGTTIPERIKEGRRYGEMRTAILVHCKDIPLSSRQIYEVFESLRRSDEVSRSRLYRVHVTPDDRKLLESVGSVLATRTKELHDCAATEAEMRTAVALLRTRGKAVHRRLAESLEASMRESLHRATRATIKV